MHTGVAVGKQITQEYYGEAHKKSYYLGCSTGGRQGFKAVQSYPDDFDGVVAGAPAIDMAYLTSWSASFYKSELFSERSLSYDVRAYEAPKLSSVKRPGGLQTPGDPSFSIFHRY